MKKTFRLIVKLNIQTGEDLTMLYLKSDTMILADSNANFTTKSVNYLGIKPLNIDGSLVNTGQGELKENGVKL